MFFIVGGVLEVVFFFIFVFVNGIIRVVGIMIMSVIKSVIVIKSGFENFILFFFNIKVLFYLFLWNNFFF